MVSIRRFASVASLFAFLAVGTGLSTSAFAAPSAGPETGEVGAHHRHFGRHGHGDLLRASLHLDSLSATQRQQVEALVQQEKAAHANVGVARSQLLQAVANRVAAGNVDEAALAPSVQAVEGAIQADEPGDRAAIEKLHAILTPAQRVELVTKIESHAGREHGNRGGPGAVAGASADGGPRPAMEHGGGMWGRALNLSDAQKQQIGANLRSSSGAGPDKAVWKEARETRMHVLEAFKADRFVMSEVAPPRDPRLAQGEVDRIVRMAKASAPVLTPEQRATAAAKLRQMAAHATQAGR
jgi:Spy/CpxP family protein refolding chaperone